MGDSFRHGRHACALMWVVQQAVYLGAPAPGGSGLLYHCYVEAALCCSDGGGWRLPCIHA